jgi:hypothetical protein
VRSVSNAHGLLQAFDVAANRIGVHNDQRLEALAAADIAATIAVRARLKDLSIVPVKPHDDQSEQLIEQLVFHSGRPVLICPEEYAGELAVAFDHVVIAWDHTAPAARAVADALPWLQAASDVRIVTATDDKTPAELESGAALASHLAEHQGKFRSGKHRWQRGWKSVRSLCEGQRDRPSGHGCLSALPAERMGVGRCDQDRHRAATLLGYDVALSVSVLRKMRQYSLYLGRREPGD